MPSPFTTKTLRFLRALKRNNDREWFRARKAQYEADVRQPMIQLIERLAGDFQSFAPEFVAEPKVSLYRIYRDTRFSADKTPYKTHIGAIFPNRNLGKQSSAGFYFHITAKRVGVAVGSYMPGPDELKSVRAWLAENHAAFRKASRKPQKLLGKLQGSSVTRMPKGFASDHPAEDLIRMKQWLYWVELDVKLATTTRLLPELVKRFRAAAPVIKMLNAPLARAARPTSLL